MTADSLIVKIKKILTGAAAQIRARGWCQNEGADADGRCCVVRAIGDTVMVNGLPAEDFQLSSATCYFLRGFIGQQDPIKWNDTPGRTKEEVLDVLDRAASAS